MSRTRVQETIFVYEVDGEPVPVDKDILIEIESYHRYSGFVVLVVKGTQFTVHGQNLIIAVQNAMNVGEI